MSDTPGCDVEPTCPGCTCGGVKPPFTETNRPCTHCVMTGLGEMNRALADETTVETPQPIPHNARWADEHSAEGAPIGTVLYDHDDDLITVKVAANTWHDYFRDRRNLTSPLTNRDIDGDRGDEIVGVIDDLGTL